MLIGTKYYIWNHRAFFVLSLGSSVALGLHSCVLSCDRSLLKLQLISKASKDTANAGLRVLDLACGKGGDLGKWAAHPDGVEKYVGSDIAFGSLEHLVERMASESCPHLEPRCSNVMVRRFALLLWC